MDEDSLGGRHAGRVSLREVGETGPTCVGPRWGDCFPDIWLRQAPTARPGLPAVCGVLGPTPLSPPTITPVPGPQGGHTQALCPGLWPPGMPLGSAGSGRPVPRRGGGTSKGGPRWGRRPPGRAGQLQWRLNGRSVLLPAAVICRWDSVSWKLVRLQVDSARPGDLETRSPGVSEPGGDGGKQ